MTIERLQQVSFLTGFSTIETVTSGLSHLCVIASKLDGDSKTIERVFVKLFKNAQTLDLQHILNIEQQTSLQGISPEILSYDLNVGCIIYKYIESNFLQNPKLELTKKLEMAGKCLAQIHQLSLLSKPINFYDVVAHLLLNSNLNLKYQQALLTKTTNLLHHLSISPLRFVFCHGDVNFHNILCDKEKAYIIDWECSGLAEPEFDIAMCLSINVINDSQWPALLDVYQQKLRQLDNERIVIQRKKIPLYYELANIINGIWFHDENHNIIKPDHQILKKHFAKQLSALLK